MARPQKIMRISKRKSVFEADNDDFTLTLYNLNYGTNYATQLKQMALKVILKMILKKK